MEGKQFEFSNLLNKVHLGKTPSFLKQFPDNCINLTITSPPYYDADLYILDDGKLEFGWQSYSEYLSHLQTVLDELLRITIEGGRVVFVLSNSPQTNKNEFVTHYWPIIHDFISYATKNGWQMMDEVIWVKDEESYPYIKNRSAPETQTMVHHDIITVLRKPGAWRNGSQSIKIPSIWDLDHVGPVKKYNKTYPSFPNKLVEKSVKAWSLPHDIILDPYAGSGQVCRISLEMDRFTIGIEMDDKWQKLWKDINNS